MRIRRELSKLKKLGDLSTQWKWLKKDIEQRKVIVDKIIKELLGLHLTDDKGVHALAEVRTIKKMLEAMLVNNDPTPSEQDRLASELNSAVSAIHYIGNLDDLHPSFWKRLTRRASKPMRVAAATAMLAGAQPAMAQTNQSLEPNRQGIEQTITYMRLHHATDMKVFFNGSNAEECTKSADSYFRTNYHSIDTNLIGYNKLIHYIGTFASKKKGMLWKSWFNKIIDGYNAYQDMSAAVDSSHAPDGFKGSLKTYYADELIKSSSIGLNLDEEKKKVDAIPHDAHVVHVKKGEKLHDIVVRYYPGFDNLSEQQKRKLYDRLSWLNPYVMFAGKFSMNLDKTGKIIFGDLSRKSFVYFEESGKKIRYGYHVFEEQNIVIPKVSDLSQLAVK